MMFEKFQSFQSTSHQKFSELSQQNDFLQKTIKVKLSQAMQS